LLSHLVEKKSLIMKENEGPHQMTVSAKFQESMFPLGIASATSVIVVEADEGGS